LKKPRKNKNMKSTIVLSGLLAGGLLAGGLVGCESEHHAEAKISKAAAAATALAQVPGGTVKDSELEKEHGKWIWSFDIAIPDSQNIKEVAVDANTGKVLAVETETPDQQAREKAEDAAEAK
jgi:uncharacterized membrane protein YkoI